MPATAKVIQKKFDKSYLLYYINSGGFVIENYDVLPDN